MNLVNEFSKFKFILIFMFKINQLHFTLIKKITEVRFECLNFMQNYMKWKYID